MEVEVTNPSQRERNSSTDKPGGDRMDQLLRKFLQIGNALCPQPCQYGIGAMGNAQI